MPVYLVIKVVEPHNLLICFSLILACIVQDCPTPTADPENHVSRVSNKAGSSILQTNNQSRDRAVNNVISSSTMTLMS